MLNVNVPNLPLDQVAGWRRTEVATLPPRALVQAELVAQAGHEGAYDVNMQWGDPVDLPVDTDSGAVEADGVDAVVVGDQDAHGSFLAHPTRRRPTAR